MLWFVVWFCKFCETESVGLMWQNGTLLPDGTVELFKAQGDKLFFGEGEPSVKQFEFTGPFAGGDGDDGPIFDVIGVWVDDPSSPHRGTPCGTGDGATRT